MLLIKNGTVVTMEKEGILHETDVLCKDGKIEAIGKNISADAKMIDAAGKFVLPGFVNPHSHVGGFAVDGSDDEDLNEITNPVTAGLSAYYGINPDDRAFTYDAKVGITTSGITPGSANVICGWIIAFKSAGKDMDSRLIKEPVALKAAMGINPKGCYGGRQGKLPGSRMGIAQVMREYFLAVKEYMKKKKEDEKAPKYDLDLEHGIPVLEKKIPLKVHSYHQDMLTVLKIADEFDFQVTLDHALGASDFYDEISQNPHVHGIIYGPVGSGIMPGELCKLDFECLKGFDDRGVLVSVMTDGPITNNHILVDEAGEAVRKGMDPLKALAMITINGAKMILVDDRVGSIKIGKDGDLLVYAGMPTCDLMARNQMTVIDGRIVYRA